MLLRPRQEQFVSRCLEALERHGNTLALAPTGFGKSCALSAIAGRHGGRVLVLQHRDELVEQNERTFRRVNRSMPTARWTANEKRWSPGCTFAMVPTLCRAPEKMPSFDLVIADEAHHARAESWRKILDEARSKNPAVRLLGVTATPNRSDRKGLGDIFTNVADRVSLGELIESGHLVMPRAFVLADERLGARLDEAKKTALGDYDMKAVEEIMLPETASVVAKWRELAADRRTIVFCATKVHALTVTQEFERAGVRAVCVLGDTPPAERRSAIRALDRGDTQVFVNVAVATEGFDSPSVSCVILLRPESFQSTLIQMIGRGLRVIDPERYPGLTKLDCVVLDFGRSLLKYGTIEQALDLDGARKGPPPIKLCHACHNAIPSSCKQCPLCGELQPPPEARAVLTKEEDQAAQLDLQVSNLAMMELDLLVAESPFRWWEVNVRAIVASAFDVWAVAFEHGGLWHAFGGRERSIHALANGTKTQCVAAGEDYLRAHGDRETAHKGRRWMTEEPTPKQLERLGALGVRERPQNRYEASCRITLATHRGSIMRLLGIAPRVVADPSLNDVTA